MVGPARIAETDLLRTTLALATVTDYTYFDGLARVREAQQPDPADSGGRVVTMTRYDDAGNVAGTNGVAFFNSGAAGSGMVNPTIASLPSYQAISTDWAGRTTRSQLTALGVASLKGDVKTAFPGADYSTVTDTMDTRATPTSTPWAAPARSCSGRRP